jgi:hypothetical protein
MFSMQIIDSVQLAVQGNHVLYLRRVRNPQTDELGWMPSVEAFGTVVENGSFYRDPEVADAIRTGQERLRAHDAEAQLLLRKTLLIQRLIEAGKNGRETPELPALIAEAELLDISREHIELYIGFALADMPTA